MLCGCRECRWLGGDAPEDHGSGLLNGFQAFAQKIGVSMPKLYVVLGCGSVLKSDRLADHESHGFGLGLADLFSGQSATVATVQHFVSLCCRQHKPTYVAQGFMWRSPRDARQNSLFDLGERHITFEGRWTGGLKDQGSGRPYSVFAEAWQACHKRKKSGK